MTRSEIYVRLLDEGSVAWRPVVAVRLDGSEYRIAEQHYDRTDEAWEFDPGDVVECELRSSHSGTFLAAVRRVSGRELR